MPVVNMEGVAVGFQPIPEQDDVVVAFTGFKNGSKKDEDGKDVLTVSLELTLDEGEHAGHKVFMNHQITDKGLPFLKESMLMLGAEPEEVNTNRLDTDKVLEPLITNKAHVKISKTTWKGKEYNNARWLANTDNSW